MNTCATEDGRELFDLSGRLDPDVARYVLERDRLYALQNGTSPLEVFKLPDEEYTRQESLRTITNRILQKYEGLVGSIGRMFVPTGKEKAIEFSDLKQEGLLGLVRALELYDPKKGGFVSYASGWIRSSMNRYRKNNALTIREPVEVQQIRFRVGKANEGGELDPKKISEETGLSEEKILWVFEVSKSYFIDIDNINSRGLPFKEVIADHSQPSTEEIAAQRELQEIIKDYISTLPEREQKVILNQYYGEKNNIEIGMEMALSESRIRELQKTALQKLKKRLPTGLL